MPIHIYDNVDEYVIDLPLFTGISYSASVQQPSPLNDTSLSSQTSTFAKSNPPVPTNVYSQS